jgi:hypothetical protein
MTLRLLIISIIFFHSSIQVNGQTSPEQLDTLVKTYVYKLKKQGIDTFCIYQDYCAGCVYTWKAEEDKCSLKGHLYVPTYIFWLESGQTFMTKKDNCFDFSTIKIDSAPFWSFFFANEETMIKEEIKMPQYIEMKNEKEEIYTSSVAHSRHQGIKVILGQETTLYKDLDDYYFTKEIGFGQQKNINYEHNINTTLKEFQYLIANAITIQTTTTTLRKTRR